MFKRIRGRRYYLRALLKNSITPSIFKFYSREMQILLLHLINIMSECNFAITKRVAYANTIDVFTANINLLRAHLTANVFLYRV